MKSLALSGCLICLLALPLQAGAASSPVTTAEEDRTRYLEFLEEHNKAQHCLRSLPDFAARLMPLLRKWKVRNEGVIRSGDAFVRTEARLDQISIEEKVEQATRNAVQKLQAMNEADLRKACDDILKWFGPDGPYSGKAPEASTSPASPSRPPVPPA